MADISNSFVQQFERNYILLSQQTMPRVFPVVRTVKVNAKFHHFDRLSPQIVQLKTSRHTPTPNNPTLHSRRTVYMNDYQAADWIDREDEIRMLISPESDYVRNFSYAMARAKDVVTLAALVGNSLSTDPSDTRSTVALPAAQTIGASVGSSNSDFNLTKLFQMKLILDQAEVPADEPRYCVINASAQYSILQDNRMTSRDWVNVKTLSEGDGDIPRFLGFNFIRTELVPGGGLVDGTTSNEATMVAFTRDACGFASGSELFTRVQEDMKTSYATQIYVAESFGAIRIEDVRVVTALCVQSVNAPVPNVIIGS